MHKNWYKMF